MPAQELLKTVLFNNPNLKAYYRFESGALETDSSGNAVTLTNNGTVTAGTGVYGGCADLGASNSTKSLTATNTLGIDGGACSISTWVKLNSEIGADYWHFVFQLNNTSDVGYGIWYEYNAGTRRVNLGRLKNGLAWNTVASTASLGTTNWNHFVMTYDGTNVRAYVNGNYIGAIASSGNGVANTTEGIGIGSDTILTGKASALIDDVAFFNVALSADQIKELYEGRFIGEAWPQSGLVAGYHLNGGSTDFSGNNNHLVNTGAVPFVAAKFGSGADFSNDLTKQIGGVNGILQNVSAFSISAWIKPKVNNTDRMWICQGTSDSSNGFISLWTQQSFESRHILFVMKNTVGSNGTFGALVKSTTQLEVGKWIHVVGTYDGSNLRLYRNGNLEATTSTSGNAGANEEFRIGRLTSSFYAANDVIDEVLVYNRVLTSQEIRKMYSIVANKYQ